MKKSIDKIKTILKENKKSKFFLIAIFLLIILTNVFEKIDVGENAIIFNSFSGQTSNNIMPGWQLVLPFIEKMTIYPTNDQTYKIYRDNQNWNNGIDASIITPTSDNQKISIDATFVYSLIPENLSYVYKRFNGDSVNEIEQNYLDDIFKNAVISTISQYSAYEVYSTKRVEIQDMIRNEIKEKILSNGLELKHVYIDTVRLSEETESIIRARALAEAAIIEAQGESDANKLLSDSLNDKIMTYEALSKLSESLKLIVVPSGTEADMDFSKILEQIIGQTDNTVE